jgi:hypothetical protein
LAGASFDLGNDDGRHDAANTAAIDRQDAERAAGSDLRDVDGPRS